MIKLLKWWLYYIFFSSLSWTEEGVTFKIKPMLFVKFRLAVGFSWLADTDQVCGFSRNCWFSLGSLWFSGEVHLQRTTLNPADCFMLFWVVCCFSGLSVVSGFLSAPSPALMNLLLFLSLPHCCFPGVIVWVWMSLQSLVQSKKRASPICEWLTIQCWDYRCDCHFQVSVACIQYEATYNMTYDMTKRVFSPWASPFALVAHAVFHCMPWTIARCHVPSALEPAD